MYRTENQGKQPQNDTSKTAGKGAREPSEKFGEIYFFGQIIRSFFDLVNIFTSIDQLSITLCADQVAQVLGISRAGAYTLMRSRDFPTIHIGKRIVVPKDKLLLWMEEKIGE